MTPINIITLIGGTAWLLPLVIQAFAERHRSHNVIGSHDEETT